MASSLPGWPTRDCRPVIGRTGVTIVERADAAFARPVRGSGERFLAIEKRRRARLQRRTCSSVRSADITSVEQIAMQALRGRLQVLSSDRIETSPGCGSIDVRGVPARPVRKPPVDVDDRTLERELGAEQPVGLFGCEMAMGGQERFSPVHAVDGIVFCVSSVEEPQHALESPGRVRRRREFSVVLLAPWWSVCRMDGEIRRHPDRFLPCSKCAHTRRQAARLKPVVGTDPAEELAVRQLEHAVHVFVRTDVDFIDA